MLSNDKVFVFNLDDKCFALYLNIVLRVLPSLEITPLPGSPKVVLGIINIEGEIIPVFNIRLRFQIPFKEMNLDDKIIIVKTINRKVAFLVDDVKEIIDITEGDLIKSKEILPVQNYIEGIMKLGDDLVLIHDVDNFLSLSEEEKLNNAIGDG